MMLLTVALKIVTYTPAARQQPTSRQLYTRRY
jgi:hypothetical protein